MKSKSADLWGRAVAESNHSFAGHELFANQATPEDTSDESMKMAADASTTPLLKPISSGSKRYAHLKSIKVANVSLVKDKLERCGRIS